MVNHSIRVLVMVFVSLILLLRNTSAENPEKAKVHESQKGDYSVSIISKKIPIARNAFETWHGLAMSETFPTAKLNNIFAIDSLIIKYKQKKLYLPVSTWRDLTMVNSVYVKISRKEVIAQIVGGDGAGAYIAKIYINSKNRIYKRIVFPGDDTNTVLEQTTYNYDGP